MLDELGLRALWTKSSEGVFGVTISMKIKYRKPVPYGEELIGKGMVEKESSKFASMKTEIFDRRGNLLANADLKYYKLTPEQIADNVDCHEEMCYFIEDDRKEIDFI